MRRKESRKRQRREKTSAPLIEAQPAIIAASSFKSEIGSVAMILNLYHYTAEQHNIKRLRNKELSQFLNK
jgi:hypothetical protein